MVSVFNFPETKVENIPKSLGWKRGMAYQWIPRQVVTRWSSEILTVQLRQLSNNSLMDLSTLSSGFDALHTIMAAGMIWDEGLRVERVGDVG